MYLQQMSQQVQAVSLLTNSEILLLQDNDVSSKEVNQAYELFMEELNKEEN